MKYLPIEINTVKRPNNLYSKVTMETQMLGDYSCSASQHSLDPLSCIHSCPYG